MFDPELTNDEKQLLIEAMIVKLREMIDLGVAMAKMKSWSNRIDQVEASVKK